MQRIWASTPVNTPAIRCRAETLTYREFYPGSFFSVTKISFRSSTNNHRTLTYNRLNLRGGLGSGKHHGLSRATTMHPPSYLSFSLRLPKKESRSVLVFSPPRAFAFLISPFQHATWKVKHLRFYPGRLILVQILVIQRIFSLILVYHKSIFFS